MIEFWAGFLFWPAVFLIGWCAGIVSVSHRGKPIRLFTTKSLPPSTGG